MVSNDDVPLIASTDSAWLCPACSARSSAPTLSLVKSTTPSGPTIRCSRPRGTLRVLLVDDEDLVRRCTARALSDFDVVSVSSGAEALELLDKDDDFDAVLSDVMMPRMTGPQLYASCAQSHPGLAQRFVFASGSPETARAEIMLVVAKRGEEHAPILLAKPSPRDALLLALYAAAANAEPRSGIFAIAGTAVTGVKINRG